MNNYYFLAEGESEYCGYAGDDGNSDDSEGKDSDADDSTNDEDESYAAADSFESAGIGGRRGSKHFITPRILSALDNAKISSGSAIHILIATAESLGHRVDELVVNRSTLHRMRKKHRERETEKIHADFIDSVIN